MGFGSLGSSPLAGRRNWRVCYVAAGDDHVVLGPDLGELVIPETLGIEVIQGQITSRYSMNPLQVRFDPEPGLVCVGDI